MVQIKESSIVILGRAFALEDNHAEIPEEFANAIIKAHSTEPPAVFKRRPVLHWTEVAETIYYIWITDGKEQIWLRELHVERERQKKPVKKNAVNLLMCEHYVRGDTVEGLNDEIKQNGYVNVQHCLRNAPSFSITRTNSKQVQGKRLVAIYSGMTYYGFYYITGFAWLEKNEFKNAELDKGTRKYLNDIGIFQPEFTTLH